MRILLTNCPLGRKQPIIFPLGLAYIASVITEHDVQCLDQSNASVPFAELTDKLTEFNPEIVGISLRNIDSLTSSDIYSFFQNFVDMLLHIKKHSPHAVIITGGAGFSLFGKEVMEQVPEIDFGVYLEGEETLPDLLNHLDDPQVVKGIYYREGSDVVFTGIREPVDFDQISIPRRDAFDLSAYNGSFGVGVQTKRGCVFDCIYCTYPFLTGNQLRLRSPSIIGEEVEILYKDFHVREIYFTDNVFNTPVTHAAAICEEIIKRKLQISWTAYFSEKSISEDFVKLALEAGCKKFTFAPDGSNNPALKNLGKGMKRGELINAYQILENLDARFSCSFIWNYPGIGWRDFFDLISLVARLKRMKNLVGLGFTSMRILPNTRLFNLAVEEGYIQEGENLIPPKYYDPFPGNIVTFAAMGARQMVKIIRNKR
jgi:anaerobic magnesium-protoporphyrin IX monomethyl ester cyclase